MNEEKYRVATMVQTCWACPAQWELTLKDGREVYVRYRFGTLSITLNPWTEDEEILWYEKFGGQWNGDLTAEDLMEHTKEVFDWSLIR
jgi:hypothetical protein